MLPEKNNKRTTSSQHLDDLAVNAPVSHPHTLQLSLQNWLDENRPAVEQFVATLQPIFAQVGKFVMQVHEAVQRARPQIMQLLEGISSMPGAYRNVILQLGERGWYLDGEMPLSAPLKYAEYMLSDRSEEAELALEHHFSSRLKDIEFELMTAFPNRAKILSAAFSAHREGKYELSVPVFLTQVDGICTELTGFSPFIRERKKNGGPSTAAYVDSLENVFWEAMLVPFRENLPMNASQSERQPGFNALNRHMVLHGESLDYGTKRNSLKAISLLNYSAQYLAQSQIAP